MRVDTTFSIRDRVIVDGGKDLVGVITAIFFYAAHHAEYQVSWVVDGSNTTNMIEEWRLTKVQEETYDARS